LQIGISGRNGVRASFNAILVLMLAAPLAGCGLWGGSPPAPMTRPTVTEAYEGDQIDQANQKAAEYCKARGLNAMLRITSVRDGTPYATYECTRDLKVVTPQ
jgi:hypothetical protein